MAFNKYNLHCTQCKRGKPCGKMHVYALELDKAVLEEVQVGMANKTSPHIDLSIDAGQLRFRRQLEAMIAEEQMVDEKLRA